MTPEASVFEGSDQGQGRGRAADVRASLERGARELRAALQDLRRLTRSKIDVRQRVAERVGVMMVAGFVFGMLWGLRRGRDRAVVVMRRC